MALCSFPDVFTWIENLPPIHQWETISMNLCPSYSSQPCLKLSINIVKNSSFTLSLFADYNLPILLWASKKILLNPVSKMLLDNDNAPTLMTNFIEEVLKYSGNKCPYSLPKPPKTFPKDDLKKVFNFSFLSLTFIICIYEAPKDLRTSCLNTLKDQFACPKARGDSKLLMRLLGSNVEEQYMRSMNLAIANWIHELQVANVAVNAQSSLFSYSIPNGGLWKVRVYCPVIAMNLVKSSSPNPNDDRLMFSLNYHQLEGVIQLNHRVTVREKWIEVTVNTDNIRCDVVKLLSDTLMNERGAGTSEKHFPSRIALQITPTMQANVISISVSKSSENPQKEFGYEKGVEASFEPSSAMGLHFSAGETVTTSLKPWKFEQSVHGNSANLNWFLHDSEDGREVFSSKPSKYALIHPKAWFKNRYSNAHRPFTRQGGVIFAGDEYGEIVNWKVDKGCMGRVMEWEIKGWIWLTYWPNKHRTLYTETRRLEFKEIVHLTLA